MAKAAEDTAFYRYFRLLALNEVGGDPRRFGMSVAAFHHVTSGPRPLWPRAMVTTATHDTKRGEDARMRLALLSEMPREWGRRVAQWLRLNRSRRSRARRRDRARPQCRVPVLPDPARRLASRARPRRRRRNEGSRRAHRGLHDQGGARGKAAVELEQPERRLRGWLCSALSQTVLDASRTNPFLAEFHAFVESLARPGAIASLAQLVLKLTVPGVPDIYQGGELWDFSLVDPDNRRPVDWDRTAGAARRDRRRLARRSLRAVAGRPRKALRCPTAARVAAPLSGAVRRRGLSAARKSRARRADISALSPGTAATKPSLSPCRVWCTSCTAAAGQPSGARRKSRFRREKRGGTCSRAGGARPTVGSGQATSWPISQSAC